MGAERYEVVIVNAKTGRQTKREWHASELLKGVTWLKRMNAQGGDIYLRPLEGPELLLVEALNAEGVEDMRRQGLAPAATLETSPGQFQTWVKLSDQPLPKELRHRAVSGLVRAMPTIGQYGRLAGFTNQQVEPNPAGRYPFVLGQQLTGEVAPAAQPYLAAVELALCERAGKEQRPVDTEKTMKRQHRDRGRSR